MEHSFHPVQEFLDPLEWDGSSRVPTWLPDYLGVDDSSYARAVGQCWLISAVARIFEPGCKVDAILVLESTQGLGKSSAFRILGGPWFTDEIADLGSKDAALGTMGAWLIELAELDSMSRSEVGKIKAFLSRNVDRFRPPYGRRLIEAPRQCVFAGSVNHNSYLRDETGARRFWPVECHNIDLEALRRDRDQLWAEAVALYRAGHKWWLDPDLEKHAKREQADRFEGGAWDELIAKWVDEKEFVTVTEILEQCIAKPRGSWGQADRIAVARTLRSLEWKRVRAKRTDSGPREWRYCREA